MKKANIGLGGLTDKSITAFKTINEKVLPVQYGDGFYAAVLQQPEYLTRFGMFWKGYGLCVVGIFGLFGWCYFWLRLGWYLFMRLFSLIVCSVEVVWLY